MTILTRNSPDTRGSKDCIAVVLCVSDGGRERAGVTVNPAPELPADSRSSRAFQIRNGDLIWTQLQVDGSNAGRVRSSRR